MAVHLDDALQEVQRAVSRLMHRNSHVLCLALACRRVLMGMHDSANG